MLKLVQTDWGVFDLDYVDPAEDDTEALVATLIYAVLFTDAEGPLERVGDAWSRRGWWADAQAGSGLWHVRRQALTDSARREAVAMIETALAARSEALSDIAVSLDTAAGNVSSVFVVVTGLHNGRKFLVRAAL